MALLMTHLILWVTCYMFLNEFYQICVLLSLVFLRYNQINVQSFSLKNLYYSPIYTHLNLFRRGNIVIKQYRELS